MTNLQKCLCLCLLILAVLAAHNAIKQAENARTLAARLDTSMRNAAALEGDLQSCVDGRAQLETAYQSCEALVGHLYSFEEAQRMFTVPLPDEWPWPSLMALQAAVDASGICDDGARYIKDQYDCSDYTDDLFVFLTARGWTVWRAVSPADNHAFLIAPTNEGIMLIDTIYGDVLSAWGLQEVCLIGEGWREGE